MRVVALKKYIEQFDDTEFSFLVADNNADVVVYVQYMGGKRDNYNRKVAMHCTPEKFERIVNTFMVEGVETVFDKKVSTDAEVDALINDAYSDARTEIGLESGWFNGFTV